MSLWKNDGFAVVMFSAASIRAAVFAETKNGLVLSDFAEEEFGTSDGASAWRKIFSRINCSKTMPMFVCGSFKGGIFFQTDSADLPVAEQRSALELELPRHLISVPNNYKLQFMSYADADGLRALVNAYIFPASSIGFLAEALSGCGRKSDGFIYPLMACRKDDPLFYSDDIEPGFFFRGGQWHPVSVNAGIPESFLAWKELFGSLFELPAALDIQKFLPLLQVARLVSGKEYAARRAGLFVLPEELRPKRFRRQLQLTVILLAALIVMVIWGVSGSWSTNRSEYKKLRDEIQRMNRETASIQARLRRQNKITKERTKIVSVKSGEQDVLAFLAGFSSLLPENVSVSNFRLNESGVDIVLASEVENLDLARVLKPLSDWKISQLQQRQNRGGSGNTINLKLIPATGTDVKKGRRR